jgi:hypothetical protein
MATPPYAGNPGSFPLTVPLLDDSTSTPDAAAFNPALEGSMDRTAWLATRAALPVMNWQSAWSVSDLAASGIEIAAGVVGCWDFWTQRFIAIGNKTTSSDFVGGNLYANYGLDGANAAYWVPMIAPLVTSGYAVAMGVAPDPTQVETYWVTYLNSAGDLKVVSGQLSGSSWTLQRTVSGASPTPFRGAELLGFGKYLIYASAGAAGYSMISSIDSTNIPGGWSDLIVGGNVLGWRLAGGGTLLAGVLTPMAIAVPWGNYAAGSSPPPYWTSLDGVTWTPRTFSFMGVDDAVGGLAWSVPLSMWLLAVNLGSDAGLYTSFYSSPDGINWTLQKAGISNPYGGPQGVQVSDLAALGPDFACTAIGVILPDAPTGSGGNVQYFSTNAGIDWWFAQANFPTNDTDDSHWFGHAFAPTFIQPTRLSAAPHMLMALNGEWGRVSMQGATPPPAAS